MKIADVKVHMIQVPIDTAFYYSHGHVYNRSSVVVEISTDEGITGYGECLCHGQQQPHASKALIEYHYRPHILGRDPFDVEVIWETLYSYSRSYGQAGSAVNAIAGVDIALWDIIGKAMQKPVHKLIGGAFRTAVQPYATGFYRSDDADYPKDLVTEAKSYVDQGFKAMKMKGGFGVEQDIAFIKEVRRSLPNDVKLMVDFNCSYNLGNARRLLYALADENIYFLEELLLPEDVDGYAQLRNLTGISLAAGENVFTIFQYQNLLQKQALDIWQPDLCSAGGFTQCKKIAATAQVGNIPIMPHVWGSGISLAASLQYMASLPYTPYTMRPIHPLLEYDRSTHPFRTDLIYDAIKMENGMVAIPQKPGIGVEVNTDLLKEYAITWQN